MKPVESALDRIRAVSGITFEWNPKALEASGKRYHEAEGEKTPRQLGLSAQQMEEHFPELVSFWTGTDGKTYRAVDYSRMVAPLIEAIKELAGRVERLEQR